MPPIQSPCNKCGQPSLVHISSSAGEEDASGESMRHLCLACAEAEDFPQGRERRLNFAAVLITVGLFITCICVLADYLGFGRHEDLGIKQLTSTGLGLTLMICAVFVRVPTVLAIGALIVVVSLLADQLAIGIHPGFGAQQITGCVIGMGLIAAGMLLARRKTEEGAGA